MFSGVIAGTGGLVKSGAGTFTLSGANSYSGGDDHWRGYLANRRWGHNGLYSWRCGRQQRTGFQPVRQRDLRRHRQWHGDTRSGWCRHASANRKPDSIPVTPSSILARCSLATEAPPVPLPATSSTMARWHSIYLRQRDRYDGIVSGTGTLTRDWPRHAHTDWRQHLHRRYLDKRWHVATWRRRHYRLRCRRHHRQCALSFRSLRTL